MALLREEGQRAEKQDLGEQKERERMSLTLMQARETSRAYSGLLIPPIPPLVFS